MDIRRLKRIASELQQQLAVLLQTELEDPRAKSVTVTAVKVSADLSVAKVYIVPRETDDPKSVLAFLEASAPHLRYQLAHTMLLRKMPELRFYYDSTSERGIHIRELLDREV